eukprot:14755070-Ditylum_brightwellii.AAC.1
MSGVKLLLSIKAIMCITKSTEELEKLATDWYNLKMKTHELIMTYAVRVKEAVQRLEGTSKAVSKEDIVQKWRNGLPATQFQHIQEYYRNTPAIPQEWNKHLPLHHLVETEHSYLAACSLPIPVNSHPRNDTTTRTTPE